MFDKIFKFKSSIVAAFVILMVGAAVAETPLITGNEFQTQTPGKTVVGTLTMCLNGSNQAIPCAGGGGGGGSVTQGTVPWVDSVTQWGGGTLGAPSNYGTSPGAVLVPGVNANVTNFPATQPVSATALPLPSGAATSANQNAATAASGGVASFARLVSSAATTNLTSIKTSAGRIYKIYGCNTGATATFMRFYNIASGSVAVGTSTVTFSREFPSMQCSSYDFSDIGAYMSNATGFAFAITGANPDNDTTVLTAGQMVQVEVAFQ